MSDSHYQPNIKQLTAIYHAGLTLDVIATLCYGVIFCVLMYQFRRNEYAAKIIPFVRYSVLVYSCLYFVSFFLSVMMSIDEYSDIVQDNNLDYLGSQEYAVIYVMENTLWSLARMSFFTLWIGRHYFSFKDSVYQSHTLTYLMLLGGLLSMFCILMFINIVIFALGKVNLDSHVLLSLVIIFGALEVMIAVSIMFLFISKLFQLILNTTKYDEIIRRQTYRMSPRSNSRSVSVVNVEPRGSAVELGVLQLNTSKSKSEYAKLSANEDHGEEKEMEMERQASLSRSASTASLLQRWQSFMSTPERDKNGVLRIDLDAKQIILINTMVMHTLLSSIALLSALVYLCMFLGYVFHFHVIESDFISSMLLTCYRPMDRILQVICIYISLNFSHSLYRLLCKPCHVACRKMCELLAKYRIQRKLIEKQREDPIQYQLL